jgi:hypothetical protein
LSRHLFVFLSRNIKIILDKRNQYAVIIGMRHERKAEKENGMSTKEPWEMSDLATSPNIPDGRVSAKKQPDGQYKLFFTGTGNEVFAGETFRSVSEARTFFRVQKLKAQAALKTEKEPWEMTFGEFHYFENKPKYDGIVAAIKAGRPVIVTTYYRATKIAKSEHIRITDSGTIQIPQGRQWIALTGDQVDSIATRAGVEVPSFENEVYHHVEVERAISEGRIKSHPDYPELGKEKAQKIAEEKEPWEMSESEFEEIARGNVEFIAGGQIGVTLPSGRRLRFDKTIENILSKARRLIVNMAMQEGKPIPAEVLRDYPELTANS